MGSGGRSVKRQLAEYLSRRAAGPVTEEEWERLRTSFGASAGYLRRLLRDSGAPLAPLVEGVRQDNFEALERTLLALEGEYEQARSAGDAARQRLCRQAVIEAKQHARWAMRRAPASPERRAEKAEMIEWMLVWLENPEVFPVWVRLRKKAARSTGGGRTADGDEEGSGHDEIGT